MKAKTGLIIAVSILAMTVTTKMASATLIIIVTINYATDPWPDLNTPVSNTEHGYNLFYDTDLDITRLDYHYSIGWSENLALRDQVTGCPFFCFVFFGQAKKMKKEAHQESKKLY